MATKFRGLFAAFMCVAFSLFLAACTTTQTRSSAVGSGLQAVKLGSGSQAVTLPSELNGNWRDGNARGWMTLEISKQTADGFEGQINFRSKNNPACRNFTPAKGTLSADGTLHVTNSCQNLILTRKGNVWVDHRPWDGVELK
ncbi:MAG: hypothetical protein H6780_01135 [Candidatus Nomurabacteria bacterium]|nr:MAG: hypothetical protein H6780_01135 [Candidatus Nomurabacteria bacterium]